MCSNSSRTSFSRVYSFFVSFFLLNYFYWSIVALHCCVSFHCTTIWIRRTYTCIMSPLDRLPIWIKLSWHSELNWVPCATECFLIGYLFYHCVVWRSKSLSSVWLFATPWTIVCQASLSLGFPRQESWRGQFFPSPGNIPHPGIEPGSPPLQEDFF